MEASMKTLLLTAVALAAFASAASASSMNLAWVACRTATNNANVVVNDVQPSQFDCANALATRNLIVSVVGAPTYTNFIGTSVQLDIGFQSSTLTNWWD